MTAHILGFDYRTQRERVLTRAEWRAEVQAVIDAGGYVQGYRGERLVYGPDTRIRFEIYDADTVKVQEGEA